jgi:uncharacterized protein
MTDPDLRKKLDALIGEPTGPKATAPDAVNQAMIRHWADALQDRNPLYVDEEFASSSAFGGIVAPPVMLQTWTMARPMISGILERGGIPMKVGKSPLSVLDELGFVGTVATNSEFEIDRYVHLGERLTSSTVIEEISDEKKTAMGNGYFCTWITTYRDENGESVGKQRFRVLKFKPNVDA